MLVLCVEWTSAPVLEVWFDPEDEVMVEETLEPEQLVVRYDDYHGGKAGTWGAGDWDGLDEGGECGANALVLPPVAESSDEGEIDGADSSDSRVDDD